MLLEAERIFLPFGPKIYPFFCASYLLKYCILWFILAMRNLLGHRILQYHFFISPSMKNMENSAHNKGVFNNKIPRTILIQCQFIVSVAFQVWRMRVSVHVCVAVGISQGGIRPLVVRRMRWRGSGVQRRRLQWGRLVLHRGHRRPHTSVHLQRGLLRHTPRGRKDNAFAIKPISCPLSLNVLQSSSLTLCAKI